MTLQQLKYVIEVAERGSITEAAKSMFIAQPSLSAAIRELEEETGTSIFVRKSRGVLLTPEQAEPEDDAHRLEIETVEDEYYVHIDHEMTKQHYISFVAAVSPDRIQMVKLYPEGNAEARFQLRGVMQILFFCNRDGLFGVRVRKGAKI